MSITITLRTGVSMTPATMLLDTMRDGRKVPRSGGKIIVAIGMSIEPGQAQIVETGAREGRTLALAQTQVSL